MLPGLTLCERGKSSVAVCMQGLQKCWMIKEPPGSCGFFVHGNPAFKETRNKHRDFTQNCQKVFNCSILGMSLGVICSVCSPLKVETNYVI